MFVLDINIQPVSPGDTPPYRSSLLPLQDDPTSNQFYYSTDTFLPFINNLFYQGGYYNSVLPSMQFGFYDYPSTRNLFSSSYESPAFYNPPLGGDINSYLYGPGFYNYSITSPRVPNGYWGNGTGYTNRNFWAWVTHSTAATNFLRSQGIPFGNYHADLFTGRDGMTDIPIVTFNNRFFYQEPNYVAPFLQLMGGINFGYIPESPSYLDPFMNLMSGIKFPFCNESYYEYPTDCIANQMTPYQGSVPDCNGNTTLNYLTTG